MLAEQTGLIGGYRTAVPRSLQPCAPQNPFAGVPPTIGVESSRATRPSILAGESSVT
jgi:hypothetical protein